MSPCVVILLRRKIRWCAWGAAVLLIKCSAPSGPERRISGEQIFARYCARCHGSDGRGTIAYANSNIQDLSDPSYIDRVSDDQLRQIIRMGKPPQMPGFAQQFIEPSLGVLIAYVRSLATRPSIPVDVSDPLPEKTP